MDQDMLPSLHTSASAMALSSQRKFFFFLNSSLVLLVAAVSLSVLYHLASSIVYWQVAVLFGSLGCTIYLGSVRPEKMWYGSRAVAESVKTSAWRFVMKADPFHKPDTVAKAHFIQMLGEIIKQNREVSKNTLDMSAGEQITPWMLHVRALSFVERKQIYRDHRISDQLEWYVHKTRYNQRRATAVFVALIVVNVLAIVFAIGRMKFPESDYWPTDIFVAMAGSVTAWAQAKRFRELSASYALASHEISLIREQLTLVNEAEFSEFIGDAENAFSREHTQWIARRDV